MRWFLVVSAVGLAVTGSASGELVARVPDGMIAVTPAGAPLVGFVRGQQLVIARRAGPARWVQRPIARVAKGSSLAALKAGVAGPVAVVVGPGNRSLAVLRRLGERWQRTILTRRLGADVTVGWPGLTFVGRGAPVVAYTYWHSRSLYSELFLAKIDARGRAHTQRITTGGFPKSYTPPPAAPVVVGGKVHVVETYGVGGAVGTIEWTPRGRTWIGVYLSAGRGGFPIGPMFAAPGRGGVVFAAWTEEFPGSLYGGFPVTLATHGREIREDVVSERGVTTGLAMTRNGPEVAANEWVSANDFSFSLTEADAVWAGTVTGRGGSEVDGRLAGLAAVPRTGAQDLLLSRPEGLSWFRSRGSLPVHVSLAVEERFDGTVALSGRVQGAHGGRVTIYREHSKSRRETAGTARLGSGGAFTLVDTARARPTYYRAVYTDPVTGIPYAKLLRDPVG